jgi:hypothetical protein
VLVWIEFDPKGAFAMRIRIPTTPDNTSTEIDFLEAARAAARSAAATEFTPDPLFSPEISRLNSVSSSALKRHGPLVERTIADELERDGFIVLRNLAVPITRGALALATSKDYQLLGNKQIAFDDSDIGGSFDFDFIAIDEKTDWAIGCQVKRGGGPTEHKKRRSDERVLRAVRFTFASWLRQQGFRGIDVAEAAIIDYLGQSKYARELTIGRDKLDEFFGLPLVGAIEKMTQAMSETLDIEFRRLLGPILTGFTPRHDNTGAPNNSDERASLRPRGRNAPSGFETHFSSTNSAADTNRH